MAWGVDGFQQRLTEFITNHLGYSTRKFEDSCGLSNGVLAASKSKGPSTEILSKISDTFPDLNMNWLVSGKGTMIIGRQTKQNGIPLLPFSAVAGFMNDNNGVDAFREESVVFSDFTDRGANCMIRVDGDSMYPRYNSGDILALRIIEPSFFQWGRVYCISTTQGCVIKKLFPDPSDENKIICRSENSALYPDYKISKEDVLAVAIVVGHAGVE